MPESVQSVFTLNKEGQRMKKGVKTTIGISCGILLSLFITLWILWDLGFRFTPEAAVHERYRDNTHIHTDEYDFYLNDVMNEGGEPCYSDSHVAVKRYGFLYKQIKGLNTADKTHNPLVAENGESVGEMYSYKGEEQAYYFIHWYGVGDSRLTTEETEGDSTATAIVTLKYWSDKITLNGEEKKLYLQCYFVTDEPIETLVIKKTNVYVVSGDFKGDYWNDDSVMVINTEADIDADQIKAHYDNGGIIVVRDRALSNDVQGIIKDTVVPECDEKDLATVFYKSKYGSFGTSVVQGNTTDLESEIVEMVANAKAKQ